jgi:hypothetical protein
VAYLTSRPIRAVHRVQLGQVPTMFTAGVECGRWNLFLTASMKAFAVLNDTRHTQ